MTRNVFPTGPSPQVEAVALVRDVEGAVLMVAADKRGWTLPGAWVRAGESVAEAAERGLRQETGLTRRLRHVLAVDHTFGDDTTASFTLVCDAGTLTADEAAKVALPDDAPAALVAVTWVPPQRLREYVLAHQAGRISEAVHAVRTGRGLRLLVRGRRVS
ncbi:NUDIX domain-containing protein [Streptomyces sp. NPDC060184]|uniref:NUDIX domain-containing protein n=1 Tax=Streptomyces sp. NPDC060184 TaxID=3347064 RepID=UPI00366651AA